MTTSFRRHQIVNAILIGVALGLVILVFATRQKMTTSEAEARANNLLQAYDEDAVTRIRFERPSGWVTLARTKMDDAGEGTWTIKQPFVEDAEPFSVQKLLGTLEYASAFRRIKPEEGNREAFGLVTPSLVLHIDMGDTHYRLRIGKEAASPKGARYVEIAGENAPGKGVVLVTKSLVSELDLPVDTFRERYVMPYLSTVLEKIELEGAGGTRKLRRAAWPDGFRFDGMLGDARTNRAALDRVLVQFAHTRADHFIDPDAAEKALSSGDTVTVTMTPIDRKSKVGVVIVGGVCPGSSADVVALRKQPDRVAACVPRGVLGGLTTTAEALVDRSLFWMRADEVEGFEVDRGDARLALDRKETGFVMRAPKEGDVDAEAGNARLDAILHATGTIVDAPDRKALGLDPPAGRALVTSSASDESKVRRETVTLSAPLPDGRVYAERQQDGVVLELGREAARALVADAALVRSRTLLDVPIADVARVEIDGTPRQVVERAPSGVLTLSAPAGFTIDGALALELCDALRTLTAERWVADKDDGTFGFDAPLLTVRLSVRKGDELVEHVLELGHPTGSGYYATMAGDPAVFVVPRRLHETLTTLVIDRNVFAAGPHVYRIELDTDHRSVVLEKRGDDFVQTDAGEPLSVEAIRKITDTLTGWRAEAAIELGPARREQGLDHPLLTVRMSANATSGEETAPVVFHIGAGDSWRGISIDYARVDGIAATYVLARSGVRAILDSL